jgi:hypothetical protein
MSRNKMNRDLVDGLHKQLESIANVAVRTLAELVEMGQSESVRLAASKLVLDYVGVAPPVEIVVHEGEVARVDDETRVVLEKLQRNIEAGQTKALAATPSVEALIVLEGDDEEPAVGGPVPGHTVIDVG